MTPEEINAAIAAKVMGWRHEYGRTHGWFDDGVFICEVRQWNPWTDANDAKLAVNRLRDTGWFVVVMWDHQKCYVILKQESRMECGSSVDFTEAVCLAALRAKGMDVSLDIVEGGER